MLQTGWHPASGPATLPATYTVPPPCLGGCGCAPSRFSSTLMMSGCRLLGQYARSAVTGCASTGPQGVEGTLSYKWAALRCRRDHNLCSCRPKCCSSAAIMLIILSPPVSRAEILCKEQLACRTTPKPALFPSAGLVQAAAGSMAQP